MKTYLIFFLSLFILVSCEDPIPSDYIPKNMVEATLIVDEPIKDIIIMKTQPVSDSFVYSKSIIHDADVKIISPTKTYQLVCDNERESGYYYPDTNELINPNTIYKLEIVLKDGTIITGETTTPDRISWIKPLPDTLYYPKDTINLTTPDSLKLEWEKVAGIDFYLVDVQCLDTLNYGIYLNPPTNEMNRRITRPWNHDDQFKETSTWSLLPSTKTPVVWLTFKWFGKHKVSVYAPDPNFTRWFLQNVVKGQYDPLLGSIKGAIGDFGSASRVSKQFFLKKNRR